jgi:hypothetical protein
MGVDQGFAGCTGVRLGLSNQLHSEFRDVKILVPVNVHVLRHKMPASLQAVRGGGVSPS